MKAVHFYVTLKDDFEDRCRENSAAGLFEDLANPWMDAQNRLTPGRLYPVMDVVDNGRSLTIIDDSGLAWTTSMVMFKYAADAPE